MDPGLFKFPDTPGMPLFPVSPERANRQHQHHAHPQTSHPLELEMASSSTEVENKQTHHAHPAASDVPVKVTHSNGVTKDAAQRRKEHEAALRRAVMGREEAELELKKLREEGTNLKREIEEGKEKERKVVQRLEGVMEDFHRTKETHARSQALYEKEVRKGRKEAFKSSSAVVKLQEELKAARSALSVTRSDLDLHRVKVGKREQDAFEAQYKLVGVQEELGKMVQQVKILEEERDSLKTSMQEELESMRQQAKVVQDDRDVLETNLKEELEMMKEQVKVVREERDALKTSLKEEEVARIAAEGRIALPVSEVHDEFSSPKKLKSPSKKRAREVMEESVGPEGEAEEEDPLKVAQEHLERETKRRKKADDQIEFMKMECQLRCCSCRIAEKKGLQYVHDASFSEVIRSEKEKIDKLLMEATDAESAALSDGRLSPQSIGEPTPPSNHEKSAPWEQATTETAADTEPTLTFSPTTGTFKTVKEELEFQHALHTPTEVIADVRPVLQQSVSAPLLEEASLMSLLHAPHHLEPTAEGHVTSTARRPLPYPPSRAASVTTTRPTSQLSRPPSREASIKARRPPHQVNKAPSHEATSRPVQQQAKQTRVVSTTTTTTVPLADVLSPSTMTREEALEQIRQRRGRARSVAAGTLTPRKQMVEGVAKRDISAPAIGSQTISRK